MRTFGILFAGSPGSGKTLTGLSFHPAGAAMTRRLVIDMESRITSYRAEEYGITTGGDDAAQLLFSCEVFPPQDVISLQQFIELFSGIRTGEHKPDVLMIDNIALFQDEMAGWCQSKENCTTLLETAGIRYKFATFLQFNFRVGDPNWWKLQKAVIKEFLMELRRHGIHFVGTTELKNVWQNYGDKGKDESGQPKQRILGKSAALWEPWLQMCDVTWNLNRLVNGKLIKTPRIELDRFAPKSSIVGIPPAFTFENWDQIWAWEKSRGITTQAQLDELKPPEVEFPDTPDNSTPVDAGAQTVGGNDRVPPGVGEVNWGDVMTRARELDPKGALTAKAKAMRSINKLPAEALVEIMSLAGKSDGHLNA